MLVRRLELKDFRNYGSLLLVPEPGLNVLVGENAQGKSNILEAIYLLATTKSFRAAREAETIRVGASEASVCGEIVEASGLCRELQLTVAHGDRKTARINGARAEHAIELLGLLRAVFFGALDLRLVTGEPAVRRRYMDLAISQTTPAYCRELAAFRRVLAHRNNVLKQLRMEWRPDTGLEVWSAQMAHYGSRLIFRRLAFAGELSELAARAHGELSGGLETLAVRYISSPSWSGFAERQAFEASFLRSLRRAEQEEIRRGTSLMGPQRDELRFEIGGLDARSCGSQGQQRTAVLGLKLAEMEFMERQGGDTPVMLLDDVMSDLDDERRARLLEHVQGRCQVFLTTTSLRGFPDALLREAAVFDVRAGKVRRVA